MRVLLGAQDAWEVQGGYEVSAPTTNHTVNQLKALNMMRMKDKTDLYLLFQAVNIRYY